MSDFTNLKDLCKYLFSFLS